jgi:hypothetical protein
MERLYEKDLLRYCEAPTEEQFNAWEMYMKYFLQLHLLRQNLVPLGFDHMLSYAFLPQPLTEEEVEKYEKAKASLHEVISTLNPQDPICQSLYDRAVEIEQVYASTLPIIDPKYQEGMYNLPFLSVWQLPFLGELKMALQEKIES